MENLGQRIEYAAQRIGGIPALIPHVDVQRGALYDYVKNTREPRISTILMIAEACNVDPNWLIFGNEPTKEESSKTEQKFDISENVEKSERIPIMGTAAGSVIGSIAINDNIIEWIPRPRGLKNIPDAYGLYVTGSSMSPRYNEGEIIFVHPHKPVVKGNIVIIQQQNHKDGEIISYIKEFIGRTDKHVKVRQYTPEATIEYQPQTVKSIHRVLSPNEIVGV